MSPLPHELLRHILDEIAYLEKQSADLRCGDFLVDETLKRAFTRSLEVIGEATKSIPDPLRKQFPKIEWRAMAGMRDRLIHGYFSVDYEIVWDVVRNKLPAIRLQLEKILSHTAKDDQLPR